MTTDHWPEKSQLCQPCPAQVFLQEMLFLAASDCRKMFEPNHQLTSQIRFGCHFSAEHSQFNIDEVTLNNLILN